MLKKDPCFLYFNTMNICILTISNKTVTSYNDHRSVLKKLKIVK